MPEHVGPAIAAHPLRALRQSRDLTQNELADLMGISQNRVSVIERGSMERVQLDTLRRFVESLGGTLHVEARVGDRRVRVI